MSSFYFVATLLVLMAGQAFTAELIELNDANKNLLTVDVARALATVQDAVANEFKFGRVEDARNFVVKCRYLEKATKDESDSAFGGLAGKMKALLKDEQLHSACHIKVAKFDEYSYLDEKEGGSFYLSKKRLIKLTEIGEKLEQDAKMNQVLAHLYESKTKNAGKQLLEHAAEDTSVFLGDIDDRRFMQLTYYSGCSVDSIKPICKLVRGVKIDDVSAYGNDLAEFREAMISNDQDTINKRAQASGVGLEELKARCKAIERWLSPISLVKSYLKAGYLNEVEINEQSERDQEFNFYYELKNLCEVQ